MGTQVRAVDANEVRLVGRLAAAPVRRALPSGDELVSFRLVVGRPAERVRQGAGPGAKQNGAGRLPSVDTLDCAAWRKGVQRAVERASAGDVLEVRGALRRRFWRSPGGGAASRSEVEVVTVRRLRRSDPGASR